MLGGVSGDCIHCMPRYYRWLFLEVFLCVCTVVSSYIKFAKNHCRPSYLFLHWFQLCLSACVHTFTFFYLFWQLVFQQLQGSWKFLFFMLFITGYWRWSSFSRTHTYLPYTVIYKNSKAFVFLSLSELNKCYPRNTHLCWLHMHRILVLSCLHMARIAQTVKSTPLIQSFT